MPQAKEIKVTATIEIFVTVPDEMSESDIETAVNDFNYKITSDDVNVVITDTEWTSNDIEDC